MEHGHAGDAARGSIGQTPRKSHHATRRRVADPSSRRADPRDAEDAQTSLELEIQMGIRRSSLRHSITSSLRFSPFTRSSCLFHVQIMSPAAAPTLRVLRMYSALRARNPCGGLRSPCTKHDVHDLIPLVIQSVRSCEFFKAALALGVGTAVR